jgi:hypothetical protein
MTRKQQIHSVKVKRQSTTWYDEIQYSTHILLRHKSNMMVCRGLLPQVQHDHASFFHVGPFIREGGWWCGWHWLAHSLSGLVNWYNEIPSRMGGSSTFSRWSSFLLACSTKYMPLRSLLWQSTYSINSSSTMTTWLSAWAAWASTLASSTLVSRQ